MIRGDLYELRAPRVKRGREQRGARYGVVLQATRFSPLSTVLVAPTSTSAQPTSFRPVIEVLGEGTQVMIEQLCALDHSRLGERVGEVTAAELEELDRAIQLLLDVGPR